MAGTRTLQVPTMTTAQRNALVNPKNGMIIYNTDDTEMQYTTDGGATWTIVADTSMVVSSLQAAYDGGNTITLDGVNPITVTGSAATFQVETTGDISARNLTLPNTGEINVSGASTTFDITNNSQGGGRNINISPGETIFYKSLNLQSGINVTFPFTGTNSIGTATNRLLKLWSDNINVDSLTGTQIVATDASKNLVTSNLSGDVTSAGTVTTLANTAVTPGSYGSATQVGTFTVDSKGRITAAANATISVNMPYTEVVGTSQSMAVDNEYTANNAALVTLTLPVTAAIGTTLIVNGKGAGGWRIAQNASQQIQVGSTATTVGVGGSVSSINQWDSITLKCVTANTLWVVQASQGNFTIV